MGENAKLLPKLAEVPVILGGNEGMVIAAAYGENVAIFHNCNLLFQRGHPVQVDHNPSMALGKTAVLGEQLFELFQGKAEA